MKISDYPKFESALSQGRPIIFLCGAGLSVSLGDHAKGWIGWLKEGKAYLSDVEAEELDALYDIYRENQVPGRRCKLLKDMERIFDETHNADVANALAILEANEHTIYDPPAVFDSNKSEILLSTENKLKEIYEVFPNEGKVVLGYSYLVSWNYVTWLDFPRPIDEELIPLFKKWIRKFPENKLELMEYYSFILFEKWLYMDSLDNISEANKIYYEIKAIADELSKDYADNQVTQMLSMGIVRKL